MIYTLDSTRLAFSSSFVLRATLGGSRLQLQLFSFVIVGYEKRLGKRGGNKIV